MNLKITMQIKLQPTKEEMALLNFYNAGVYFTCK